MVSFVLPLLIASIGAPVPPQKFCTVPCKKPTVKKVVKKTTPVAPKETCCPGCCAAPVQQQNQTQTVIVNVTQAAPVQTVKETYNPSFGVGIRGGVGLWSCRPHLFGTIGVRARLPYRLGVDVGTNFDYGYTAQVMVYPVQTYGLGWHLNTGVLFGANTPFSNATIKRDWDWYVGTGLEVRLPVPFLSFTADWRWSMPNALQAGSQPGKTVNWGHMVGNSLYRSQLYVGVLAHTW
jgi:hypothetical protein